MNDVYDAIIVGSGAGGAAVAYKLVRGGKRVLLLEKGAPLPRDRSTLDVKQVFKEGRFKNKEQWVDGYNKILPDYASSSAMVTIPSACESAIQVRHACSLRASATRASDLERGYGRRMFPLQKSGDFIPGEFYNVGGKTKWYGAALLRFAPHEFRPDETHQCLGWPIGHDELAPYYDEAERTPLRQSLRQRAGAAVSPR